MNIESKRVGFYSNRSKRFTELGLALNITKNKALETTILWDKDPPEWFRICTQWTRKTHQPGWCLSVALFWLRAEITIFDKRNWDYKNNKYQENIPSPEFKYF